MTRRTDAIILASIAGFSLTQPAYAYLDPGTGSIILQGIIGSIAGGLFLAKMQWARLKGWFGTKAGERAPSDAGE